MGEERTRPARFPRLRRSLTGRVLRNTFGFAALWAAVSYVASMSAFWQSQVEDQIRGAYDTIRVVRIVSEDELDAALRQRLLDFTRTHAVIHRTGEASTLVIGDTPATVDKTVRPATASWPGRVRDAFDTLINGRGRILRIVMPAAAVVPAERDPRVLVEVVAPETPLAEAMWQHSLRFGVSAVTPFVVVGVLLFFVLQRQFVRPVRTIIGSLESFARNPDGVDATVAASSRRDEIGDLERGVLSMQGNLRELLHRRDREAALGASVSQINHDLRNVLQGVALTSGRIGAGRDPVDRESGPLREAVERAVQFCTRILDYQRFGTVPINPEPTRLRDVAVEVGDSVAAIHEGRVAWRIEIPAALKVEADPVQLFRALLNLAQNATDAMPDGGAVSIRARRQGSNQVAIEVEDNGPGLREEVRAFFERPFADGEVNPHGLGLVIVRNIMSAHGGTFELDRTSPAGTRFLLTLPT